MVGQANAQAKAKSSKQQVLYGIPEFLIAFGCDALSPKQTNLSEEIFASPNLFVQLFVNVAHRSFGENYIRSIWQMVLDIAI
jgi:hypothetical protein